MFLAGTALNWTDKIRQEDIHSHFSEGIELAFDTSVFLVIGTLLPWHTWTDPDFLPPLNLLVVGALILAFRRLPAVMALYKLTPQMKTWKEACFCGWFGPIGAGALYYALLATEELPDHYVERNRIIPAVTFVVLCSIVVHGTSAPLIMLASVVPRHLATTLADLKSPSRETESNEPRLSSITLPDETTPLLPNSNSVAPPSNTLKGFLDRFGFSRVSPPSGLTRAQVDALMESSSSTRDAALSSAINTAGVASSERGSAYKAMGDPDEHRHRRRNNTGDVESVVERAVTVYDEGNILVFDDGEGNVTLRRVRS